VGGRVDPHRLTQVGRALRELGIQMIPAYSPQARGRSERNFGTWQGRLPQELRLLGIQTLEAANTFLGEHYVAEFNRRFQVQAAERGSAFVPRRSRDLDLIFALQFERTVNRDNTVNFQNLSLQIEPVRWRASLAGCTVMVHQHLDGTLSLTHGPHRLGRYSAQGAALAASKVTARRAVEKTQTARASHFPPAPATAAINSNRTSHVLRKPGRFNLLTTRRLAAKSGWRQWISLAVWTSRVRTSHGIITCLKIAGSGHTFTCRPRWPP
jgi:hypothetical protein